MTRQFYSQLRRSNTGTHYTKCNQDHNHHSAKEARRCDELTMLEKGHVISNLEQQPKFVLQQKLKYRGETIRAITYSADFMYIENGDVIVEDVKGFERPNFVLKKKMLFKYFLDNGLDYIFKET